jgi:hypothetical protein
VPGVSNRNGSFQHFTRGSGIVPDGWTATTGTWSVDMERESSVVASGNYSIHMRNAASAYKMTQDAQPIASDRLFMAETEVRASGTGVTLTVAYEVLDASLSVLSTTNVVNTTMTAANTWYKFSAIVDSGTTGRFGRFTIAKSATAQDAYFDRCIIRRFPMYISATRSSTQNITSGASPKKIEFNNAQSDLLGMFDTATNYRFTASYTMIVQATASAYISTSITDGKQVSVLIYKNGAAVAEQDLTTGVSIAPVIQAATGPIALVAGDYLEAYVYHNLGSDATLSNDSKYTWFKISEIGQ